MDLQVNLELNFYHFVLRIIYLYPQFHVIPIQKIFKQKEKYKIKNYFILSKLISNIKFCDYLSTNKFQIIYFLDYGAYSLKYLELILKNNQNTYISIANKEMIIAGGKFLKKSIEDSNNFLLPMDSEHFSLMNSNFNKNKIIEVDIYYSFRRTILF